jgi:hypothetical protein
MTTTTTIIPSPSPAVSGPRSPVSGPPPPSPSSSFLVTAAEIAEAVNRSARQIRRRADDERWPQAATDGHLYHPADLPPDVRGPVERWLAARPFDVNLFLSTPGHIYPYGRDEFTDDELAVARQKANWLLAVQRHRDTGANVPQSLRSVLAEEDRRRYHLEPVLFPLVANQMNTGNYYRWMQTWEPYRVDPRSDQQWWCLASTCGVVARRRHRSLVDRLALTEAEIRALRSLKLDCDSDREACAQYLHRPGIRPIVRDALERVLGNASGSIPDSIKRALYIPPETRILVRNKTTFQHHRLQIRDDTYVDATGQRRQLLPGDLWEADDMTLNQPWYYDWPFGGDPCSEKYGVRVGRGQLLAFRDVMSGRWVSCVLIARVRDSYRAEDIWSWFHHTFTSVGMPRVGLRLERGIWRNKSIDGVPLWTPADEAEKAERFGGLAALGVGLTRAFGSKGKGGIEGGFNTYQTSMAALLGPGVGRKRGEFRNQTRWLGEAQAGRLDPRTVKEWLPMDQMLGKVAQGMAHRNAQPVRGRIVKGVPDKLWAAHVNDANPLPKLPSDKEWLFLPVHTEVRVHKGVLWATHDRCPFLFEAAPFAPVLSEGFRVKLAFDPLDPERGAWLHNAEPTPKNVENWPLGHFIGVAPFQLRCPQADFSNGLFADQDGYNEMRKRHNQAYRRAYYEIRPQGQRGAVAVDARQPSGETTRVAIDRSESPISNPAISNLPPRRPDTTPVDLDALLDRASSLETELTETGDLITL